MTRRRILTGWAIGLLLGVMAAGTALGAESGWKTEDGVLKFVDNKGNYVTCLLYTSSSLPIRNSAEM